MQALLCDLVRSFEFATVAGVDIVPWLELVSAPRIAGREGEGSRLPLIVRKV